MRSTYFHVVEVLISLLNGSLTGMFHAFFRYFHRSIFGTDYPFLRRRLDLDIPSTTLLKKELISMVISTMASLGTFEILTKNLRLYGNHGRPLSLYQEACCGLISGAAAALTWSPFQVALNKVGLKNLTYTNWFTTLSRIIRNEARLSILLSDWLEGLQKARFVAGCAAVLVTYDRSKTCLIQTQLLSNWIALLSASVIAGIFFSACFFATHYVGEVIKSMQLNKDHMIPSLICGFFKSLPTAAAFCMVHYTIYEFVRGVEWTK